MNNKINTLKLALAGGIWLGICGLLITIFAVINVPGFESSAELMNRFYEPYGYSISWLGSIVGAFWGFVEGFIHLGFLAWIYNQLSR